MCDGITILLIASIICQKQQGDARFNSLTKYFSFKRENQSEMTKMVDILCSKPSNHVKIT